MFLDNTSRCINPPSKYVVNFFLWYMTTMNGTLTDQVEGESNLGQWLGKTLSVKMLQHKIKT